MNKKVEREKELKRKEIEYLHQKLCNLIADYEETYETGDIDPLADFDFIFDGASMGYR